MRSSFFNSVNGDRKYNASSFAEYFSSFIANGVFPNPSTNLQVLSNSDMTVTIKPGKAWIDGYIVVNDNDFILNLDVADGILNRIDRVVARLDTIDREIRIEVKKGSNVTTPASPQLQRDADAYELALADIYIAKGIVSISQANITDTRLNSELCGVVKGTIDEIDTTTLFNQYQAWLIEKNNQLDNWFDTTTVSFENDFNNWFLSIQDILDTNIAADLLNRIEAIDASLLEKLDTTATAADSAKLAGQLASYYTDIIARLGYTPLSTTGKAADSNKLAGQLASYYTDIVARLGYTPLDAAAPSVDSERVGGYAPSTSPLANTAAIRNSSGYLEAVIFKQSFASLNPNVGNIMTQISASDGYMRPTSPTQFIDALKLFTESNYGNVPTFITGSSTLTAGYKNTVTCTNSTGAINLTIPANTFAIGSQITIVRYGTGAVTFLPASGVTLYSVDNKRSIKGRFSSATLVCVATNVWVLIGALE